MQWYCAIDGKQYGPEEESVLAQWVREGRLHPHDLVWNPAQGDQWIQARKALPALFGIAAAPAIPPAAPPPLDAGAASTPPDPGWSAVFASRTHNRDIMAAARAALTGHWWLAAGFSFVFWAIAEAANTFCVGFLIMGALSLGYAIFALAATRSQPLSMGQLFEGFQNFGTALAAYILMLVFVLLWMLLLIIPGIVAALAYSMTYFILRDNPQMGPLDAIRLSRRMMSGNKWKYFCLQWRFFWWALLCLLTCGIGFFWLMPYMAVSQARFYEDLKAGRA